MLKTVTAINPVQALRSLRISLPQLWILAVMVGIFFFANTHPIRPHDFWWHMAVGREIVASGKIPAVDVYSYTMAGQAYPSYASFWLMEVFLYAVYSLGGPALVVFTQTLLITSAYGIILWLCWRAAGNHRAAALGLLFAAALGFNDWNVRPQTVAFLFGALFLLAIDSCRRRPDAIWLLFFPLGMAVWVNSHGSFPIGLGLVGIWFADSLWQVLFSPPDSLRAKRFQKLLIPGLALLLAFLAVLANPRGLGVLEYLSAMAGSQAVQNLVPEWAPPGFDTPHGAIFLAGLLVTAVVLAVSPRRPVIFQIALFCAFAVLGLKTARGVVWFGLLLAPQLAAHLGAIAAMHARPAHLAGNRQGFPVLNGILFVFLVGLASLSLPWFKSALPLPELKAGLLSAETPVSATRYLLDERPPGLIFHAQSFGSYLIWAAYPGFPVFIDSRFELYSPEVVNDYLLASNAVDWEARLARYGVRTLMLSPAEQGPLVAAVQASPGWEQVYRDGAAIVFVKRNP
jgi:hypothetical protein